MSIQDEMSKYIHLSKYARWIEKEDRRELTWKETIGRLDTFWRENRIVGLVKEHGESVENEYSEAIEAIINHEIMPSMRTVMSAGRALERDNLCGFGCAATAVDSQRAFDEIFYILMSSCGATFSVERQYISKLPTIHEEMYPTDTTIVVKDSKTGWAKALKELIALLYQGEVPKWDMSLVRPAGARLKTFGGRACLTGDTILYKDRKKSRTNNEITIRDLYNLQESLGKWERVPNHFKSVKVRSLNEDTGEFFRNNVLEVINNGVAPVYRIETSRGYSIRATLNHRFLDPETGDYKYVEDFSVGDIIGVNGSKEKKTGVCVDCQCAISRRSIRCKGCQDINQQSDTASATTARYRKERRSYKLDYCEECCKDGVRFEVHHVDRNPLNNNHSNLVNLCAKCHRKLHAREDSFGSPYSHKYLSFDTIVSIEYVGEEEVFDIRMKGPNHNFVANGFVSHNSGPEPLDKLFRYTVNLFSKAKGRKLNSIECHDLLCNVADVVIVGSVRRAACMSISNLTDLRMARAKSGEWYTMYPWRSMANNSVAYTEQPDLESFMTEMVNLYESKSGERGILNKEALRRKAESCDREYDGDYLLNPCGEAILRDSGQFCNLTDIIVRPTDSIEDIKRKARLAATINTMQASLSNFKYLRKVWTDNHEEERLIGVTLNGVMDNPLLNGSEGLEQLSKVLSEIKKVVRETNRKWSKLLGINESKQLTLIKPSGTVSQLVGTASGLHPRYSEYYLRRVTQDVSDPLTDMMIAEGVPHAALNDKVYFTFPMKSPDGSITAKSIGAIKQLELWKVYQKYWCDGNPSQTIYYTDKEFLDVQAWLYKNWDIIGGLSFFPLDDFVYNRDIQPYLEVTKEEYEKALESFPEEINWDRLTEFEKEDSTTANQELACSGGACEI